MFDMVGEIDLRLAIALLLHEGRYRLAFVCDEEPEIVLSGAVRPLLEGGVPNDFGSRVQVLLPAMFDPVSTKPLGCGP